MAAPAAAPMFPCMFLEFLRQRETGVFSPRVLRSALTEAMFETLEQTACSNPVPASSSACTVLAAERHDGHLVLGGWGDGTVALYDTRKRVEHRVVGGPGKLSVVWDTTIPNVFFLKKKKNTMSRFW
jgi:hypothetical protein